MINERNVKAARHRLRLMTNKAKRLGWVYTKFWDRLSDAIEEYEDAVQVERLNNDPEFQALLDQL